MTLSTQNGREPESSGNLTPCEIYTNTQPIRPEQWYFFTGVVDLKNHIINIYRDGVLEGSITEPDSSFRSNPYELHIGQSDETVLGQSQQPSYPLFTGAIDEVRLYNRALSTTEINQLYSISFLINKNQCKNGGWRAFYFKNQGECVSAVERYVMQ